MSTNSSPTFEWSNPDYSTQGSDSPPSDESDSIFEASAPPIPKPRASKSPATKILGKFNDPDPFANLPTPIPVPIRRQGGSQGGGSFVSISPPPSRGSYAYNFTSGSEGFEGSQTNYSSASNGSSSVMHSPSYKNTYSSNSSFGMAPPIVSDPKDLEILGKFDHVNSTDEKFKMITTYVNNSHGIKNGSVKVHNIYQLNKAGWGAWFKSQLPFSGKGSENTLLWYKTSPRGIQKLAGKMNGCVAFYDRLGRAFPENPRLMKNPSRQIIILCAVSLGNFHSSPDGFQRWVNVGKVPRGFNSVKGVGKLVPDYSANTVDDACTVPSGPTKKNGEHKNYELDFNEYIIFDASRIQIKYAVDLEVFPSFGRQSSNLSAVSENKVKFGYFFCFLAIIITGIYINIFKDELRKISWL